MSTIENKMIYVLTIVDEGIIQLTATATTTSAIKEIAQKSIRDYLSESGYKAIGANELLTEDGYANISRTELNNYVPHEYIWSYAFDGEEIVEKALERFDSYSSELLTPVE